MRQFHSFQSAELMYTNARMNACTHAHTPTHAHMHTSTHAFIYIHTHTHTSTREHTCVCKFGQTHAQNVFQYRHTHTQVGVNKRACQNGFVMTAQSLSMPVYVWLHPNQHEKAHFGEHVKLEFLLTQAVAGYRLGVLPTTLWDQDFEVCMPVTVFDCVKAIKSAAGIASFAQCVYYA